MSSEGRHFPYLGSPEEILTQEEQQHCLHQQGKHYFSMCPALAGKITVIITFIQSLK